MSSFQLTLSKFFANSIVIFTLLFILASIFRIFFLNLIEYKADEALTIFELTKFYNQPFIFQVGLYSSLGVHNFPLFYTLMLPFTLFSTYPITVSFLIAFTNSLLIASFYFLAKRFYSPITALLATIFLALSPWNILFNRKIWAQDLIPLFSIPIFYLLHQIILEKKSDKLSLPLFLLLTLQAQLHGSGIHFFLITIILFLIMKVKVNLKKAFIGILIGAIPALPYINYQISSSPSCPDCQAFINYLNTQRFFDIENFFRPFQLLTGLTQETELGYDGAIFLLSNNLLIPIQIVFIYISIFFLLGLVIINLYYKKYYFLTYYMLALPLVYFLTKTPSYMHYFLVIAPFVAITFSQIITHFLSQNKKIYLKVITTFGVLVLILSNLIFQYLFNNFLSDKKIIQGGYGPIFQITDEKTNQALAPYKLFTPFNLLQSYTYIFINTPYLHSKLGEFFLRSNLPQFAEKEFIQVLDQNPKDIPARANLAYIYIQTNNSKKALEHLNILKTQDPQTAQKLIQLTNFKDEIK